MEVFANCFHIIAKPANSLTPFVINPGALVPRNIEIFPVYLSCRGMSGMWRGVSEKARSFS
jgi:hypothetical protein